MNLLGKILVVLVSLASIMFLGVSIAVFTTHKNWDVTVKDQQAEIQELNAETEKLSEAYKRYVSSLEQEIEAAQQQVIKLENERATLEARNNEVQAELERLRQTRRDLTSEVASVQASITQLIGRNEKPEAEDPKDRPEQLGEIDRLEREIDSNQQAINKAFDRAVAATSELHEAKIKLEIELERNAQLVEQVGGNE